MKESKNKKPLLFESTYDLRNKLTDVYNREGMRGFKEFLEKEFTDHRALQIGGENSNIFGFQLLHLNNTKSERIILDYHRNPTLENSTLFLTVNFLDTQPKMQLLIRKEQKDNGKDLQETSEN